VPNMLHLVFSKNNAQQALNFVAEGDAILFMESSTLSLLNKSTFAKDLQKEEVKVKFYALASDLQLRGIANDELAEVIDIIDYPEFVALTLEHSVIKTWN